jgi:hypothetical protein
MHHGRSASELTIASADINVKQVHVHAKYIAVKCSTEAAMDALHCTCTAYAHAMQLCMRTQ